MKEIFDFYKDHEDHTHLVHKLNKDFLFICCDCGYELDHASSVELFTIIGKHDDSKINNSTERKGYIEMFEKLNKAEYGSKEYFDIINNSECIKLHYKNNPHHPEYYENGFNELAQNELRLHEMVCDMLAAYLRKNTDLSGFSFDIAKKRYNISDFYLELMSNTMKTIRDKKVYVPNTLFI